MGSKTGNGTESWSSNLLSWSFDSERFSKGGLEDEEGGEATEEDLRRIVEGMAKGGSRKGSSSSGGSSSPGSEEGVRNAGTPDAVTSEAAGCGPHRRGYVAVGRSAETESDSEWQLVICTESDMKSDAGKRICLGTQVLQLEDFDEVEDRFREKAHDELGETPDVRVESLKRLREKLEKQRDDHGLVSPLDNDTILLSYLRAAHFNIDGAVKKILDYYAFKRKYPDYCNSLLPQNECRAFQNNLLAVLPKRDSQGRRILVVQAGKRWDPSTCSVKELVRGIMMIVKAAILEPVTQISGAIVIIDVKELGYSQMRHLISLSLAEMLVSWVQDCFPTRLKAIHVVNINALFGLVLNVFKKFLNEKFQKRVIVHNKPDTLNIEKEILPKELGGTSLELPDNQGMLLHKLICLYQDKYEQVSKYGYPKDPEKKEKRGWF